MKRLGLLLSGCLFLAGCAHENPDYAGGGSVAMGGYPYAGLNDCSGYVYGYDPYDPYVYSSGYGGPCGRYDNRYYGYPYSYNYGQAGQRQQITTVKRSSHPRTVAPRSSSGSPPQSSSSSNVSSSARAPVASSSSSPPATHTVSPRR